MPLVPFLTHSPAVGTDLFLAPTAYVIGRTTIGNSVSIFFNATLRGDIQRIVVGDGTNIQEGALLHTSHDLPDCIVGENVTVGHSAIIHGCTIGDNCIVGMGSVILDGAKIGRNCIIGAQALVPLNTEIPDGSLVLGVPAKVVRQLTAKEIEGITQSARGYQEVGREYRKIFNPA